MVLQTSVSGRKNFGSCRTTRSLGETTRALRKFLAWRMFEEIRNIIVRAYCQCGIGAGLEEPGLVSALCNAESNCGLELCWRPQWICTATQSFLNPRVTVSQSLVLRRSSRYPLEACIAVFVGHAPGKKIPEVVVVSQGLLAARQQRNSFLSGACPAKIAILNAS